MTNQKVLITGCGGMLGDAVYAEFSKNYSQVMATDINLTENWLTYLDVREIDQCEKAFDTFKPDIVLHLAALTDLEFCENDPDNTWKTNALGTENIALLAKKHNATMVYISTAGVFDGNQEYYNDFDQPNPLNYYAKSKYHGEVFVQRYLEKFFIFRAGWMMGSGVKKDKKFINKIFKQIQEGKKELFIVDDKLGTPTYTVNFAQSIFKVMKTGYYGLYNQVCSGSCSRYDVAVKFIEYLNLTDKIKITKVDSSYFEKEYFALRPYSEKLVNLKLESRKINFMEDWEKCLEEYSKVFINQLK
ncbi:MAG: NAD(P)-dependent oxidoreductase [Bacteroidetes bacterium GWF2_38_335]|nr:MAG: NAD(P)-dependent oxidoreductase [Bacteroidetes bacterium GWF2_38_335]OFY79338.1 MAG: NAD(P)-dependent oxidoreductase [Bacteroidetes bacterium RIFOXYA12_FULL_38_20]HBS85597.1 NAD(P)-dependent oxidoreductase [Bacteroidales bacterium]